MIDSLRQNTTLERLILPILHVLDIKNSGTIVDRRVTVALDDRIKALMYCIDKVNEST